MSNLEWIKEIDYKKHLNENETLIVQEFGIEGFVKLLSLFGKTRLYFSEGAIVEMQKEYIRQSWGVKTVRELSRQLNVSDEFIRKAVRE